MNTDYVNIASLITIVLTSLMIAGIWGSFLYYGFRKKGSKSILRSATVLGLFIVWILTMFVKGWLSPNANWIPLYSTISYVGYLVFPLTLIALWRVVLFHVGDYLYYLYTARQDRILIIIIGSAYGIFYFFASGMLSLTDPNTPTLSERGYIVLSDTYGPLSIWPSIEFWIPMIHLYGSISIAGIMMLFTLVGMISIGSGLVVYQWRLKKKWDIKMVGSTVSSSIAVTATCFVSCSLPAVYPLLIGIFGQATAEPIAQLLGNKTGIPVNLLQMAVLSLMVASISLTAHRLRKFENRIKLVDN